MKVNNKIQKEMGFDTFCISSQKEISVCYIIAENAVRVPSGGCFCPTFIGTLKECINKVEAEKYSLVFFENPANLISKTFKKDVA